MFQVSNLKIFLEGRPQTKLEELVGLAAQAIGTALEKKASDTLDNIKGKVLKRLRDEEPEDNYPPTDNHDYKKTTYLPQASRTIYQSLRRTYRKKRGSKKRRN